MNASTKNSRSLRYAALLLVVVLGGLLFIRPRLGTGRVRSPAVDPAPVVPAPSRAGVSRNTESVDVAALPIPAAALANGAPAPRQADVSTNLASADAAVPSSPAADPVNDAPPPRPAEAPGNAGLSETDRAFLERAVQISLQESELSGRALRQLIYPEVREYACMILDQHTAASAEFTGLAARKGVALAPPEKISFKKWRKDDGSLDQAYVGLMADGNREVVELLQQAAQSRDADVATFARKMLPLYQAHLSAARDLKKVTE